MAEPEQLVVEAERQAATATTLDELSAVRTALTGKRSPLVAARKALGNMEPAARKQAGQALNAAKASIDEILSAREAATTVSTIRNARRSRARGRHGSGPRPARKMCRDQEEASSAIAATPGIARRTSDRWAGSRSVSEAGGLTGIVRSRLSPAKTR